MANIFKRVWNGRGPSGRKVRKVSYGYTLQIDGRQERKVDARWTKEQAQEALAARVGARDASPAPASLTFGEAVARS